MVCSGFGWFQVVWCGFGDFRCLPASPHQFLKVLPEAADLHLHGKKCGLTTLWIKLRLFKCVCHTWPEKLELRMILQSRLMQYGAGVATPTPELPKPMDELHPALQPQAPTRKKLDLTCLSTPHNCTRTKQHKFALP